MLVMRGHIRDKILNTKVSSLAENLQIDYYDAFLFTIPQKNNKIFDTLHYNDILVGLTFLV